MANNKITQLRSLTSGSISPDDLFPVVDVDDLSSPTGETKNIKSSELAAYINSTATDGGSVINQFGWRESYVDLLVGMAVKVDSAGNLQIAESDNIEAAEAVGLITSKTPNKYVTVTFSGMANFATTVMYQDIDGNLMVGFNPGDVYFLGTGGYLRNVDPTESNTGWVSKPMMVAQGVNNGIIVNYRGLVNELPEETSNPWQIVIRSDVNCYDFGPGDVVRRAKSFENSKLPYLLADADSLATAEVIGVVSDRSTSEAIIIQTTGYIDNLCGLIPGETYYVTPRHPNADLGILGFDIQRSCQRNVTPVSPVCPYFSHPVYIAISQTEAVIINQRTLPNPDLDSSVCQSGEQGRFRGTFQFDRPVKPGANGEDAIAVLTQAITFLVNNPISGDTAEMYWMNPNNPNDNTKQKWLFRFVNGIWVFLNSCSCNTP